MSTARKNRRRKARARERLAKWRANRDAAWSRWSSEGAPWSTQSLSMREKCWLASWLAADRFHPPIDEPVIPW